MGRLGAFEENTILVGDCIQVMAQLPDACVDAIVTDPPYGLEFMGKEWDRFKAPKGGAGFSTNGMGKGFRALPSFTGSPNPICRKCGGTQRGKDRKGFTVCRCDIPDFPDTRGNQMQAYQSWTTAWAAEAYRILKPGAYMLVMGGTRTHHRLGCGLEDAGFEIRDELVWIYASGFPKNYDVSKGIDKRAGAEREVVGRTHHYSAGRKPAQSWRDWEGRTDEPPSREYLATKPTTPEAQYWEGYGTALKPAHEAIWLCKKPNEGTYVDNVLKHGCGAMNIEGSRIHGQMGDGVWGSEQVDCQSTVNASPDNPQYRTKPHIVHGKTPGHFQPGSGEAIKDYRPVVGRWPANVLVDCYPEEFIGGGVVLEREIKLHGPPKKGLRGPEITWERTGESEGDRELWVFTETYFDDEEMVYSEEGIEEGCAVYPYPQFVWLRKTIGGVVIEGEAQLHHGGPIRAKTSIGDGNIYQGGGSGLRREPDESSRGNGLLGPYTRFFVIPKPSKREKNRGCEELYYRKAKGGHVRIEREEWEQLVKEEERIKEETGKRKILQARGNIHVTVKPVRLGKWLIKLITPHQHPVIILDNFCGSGSFLVSAVQLNQEQGYQIGYLGIDKDEQSVETALARVKAERLPLFS